MLSGNRYICKKKCIIHAIKLNVALQSNILNISLVNFGKLNVIKLYWSKRGSINPWGMYFFKKLILLACIDRQVLITFLQKCVFSMLGKRCAFFCPCCPLALLVLSNWGFEAVCILGTTFWYIGIQSNTYLYLFCTNISNMSLCT